MSTQVAHLQGALASDTAQMKSFESDLKEFKDINKRYRDQLIKVKVRYCAVVCGTVVMMMSCLALRYGKQRPREVREGS